MCRRNAWISTLVLWIFDFIEWQNCNVLILVSGYLPVYTVPTMSDHCTQKLYTGDLHIFVYLLSVYSIHKPSVRSSLFVLHPKYIVHSRCIYIYLLYTTYRAGCLLIFGSNQWDSKKNHCILRWTEPIIWITLVPQKQWPPFKYTSVCSTNVIQIIH